MRVLFARWVNTWARLSAIISLSSCHHPRASFHHPPPLSLYTLYPLLKVISGCVMHALYCLCVFWLAGEDMTLHRYEGAGERSCGTEIHL